MTQNIKSILAGTIGLILFLFPNSVNNFILAVAFFFIADIFGNQSSKE